MDLGTPTISWGKKTGKLWTASVLLALAESSVQTGEVDTFASEATVHLWKVLDCSFTTL